MKFIFIQGSDHRTWLDYIPRYVTNSTVISKPGLTNILYPGIFQKDDIVFIHNLYPWTIEELHYLKKSTGILLCHYNSVHTEKILDKFKYFDMVFTGSWAIERILSLNNINVKHLPNAFDPINARFAQGFLELVGFTGSLSFKPGFHRYRIEVLTTLLERGILRGIPMDIRAALDDDRYITHIFKKLLYKTKLFPHHPGMRKLLLEEGPTRFRYPEILKKSVQPPVSGRAMMEYLQYNLITVHAESDYNIYHHEISSMRPFEITGMGSMLLMNHEQDIENYFDLDKEVVTYTNSEHCADLVEYYQSHTWEAREIAVAGQKRTLTDHTVRNRVKEILDAVNLHENIKKDSCCFCN